MSALVYTTSALLEGKYYRSRSRRLEGIIQEAEIAPEIYYGENDTAYRVRVRPQFGDNPKSWGKDFWAVVAVRKENV
jgi:hypothetical protein